MLPGKLVERLSALRERFVASSRTYRRPLIDPVIAHIHVPKCGGTAFRKFLIQHYGAAHLALYVPDTYFVYTPDQIAEYLQDRSVRGFSSHFVRTFPDRIAGRDIVYVTFVRNPVDQVVSYVTYIKANFDLIPDKPLLSALPPDPTGMPVREIARWILTCDREVNFHENFTVNFFARYSLPGATGPFRLDKTYVRHRLSAAMRIVDRFFFVGDGYPFHSPDRDILRCRTELNTAGCASVSQADTHLVGISDQMDLSVAILRNLMERSKLDFPEGKVPVDNTSFEFRDDLGWIHQDDEVGRLLLNSVREDQALYQQAVKRLQALELRFPFRES